MESDRIHRSAREERKAEEEAVGQFESRSEWERWGGEGWERCMGW